MRPAIALAAALAASGTPSPGANRISVSDKECEVIRVLSDGRQVKSSAASAAAISADGRSANGSSRATASTSGSARSSVSVSSSSSSSSSGGGSARATSSYTDEDGRTVTTTRDERGCTIVIDERD